MERVTGIEPAFNLFEELGWKPSAQPLCHTRMIVLEDVIGLEPITTALKTQGSTN